MITDSYGTSSMKKTSKYEWFNVFKNDPSHDVTDRPRSGRPSATSEKADEIRELLQSDRRLTIRDIGLKVGLSTSTVHSIVTRKLGMSKVCARWIPRILTIEQKHLRVEATKSFLKQYRNHGQRFMNSVITADETWISVYDPENKQD